MHMQVAGMTLTALVFFTLPAAAQDVSGQMAQSSSEDSASIVRKNNTVAASGQTVTRGTITNVNAERREFTVKRKNGDEVVVPAGSEIKNFDQIKVGDQIVLRASQSIVLSLRKAEDGTAIRQRSVSENIDVAKLGEKPGISATRQTHVIADVIAVNKKAGTITLKGPHQTRTLELRDRSLLTNIKKGDQIEALVVEGEALSVERATTQ